LKYSVVIEVKEVRDFCPLYKLGDKIVIKEFYVDWKSSENICMHLLSATSKLLSAFIHRISTIELGIRKTAVINLTVFGVKISHACLGMLRKAIHEGWIRVRQPSEDRKKHIINLFSEIDEGEAAVIAVALEDNEEPIVIIDDAEARVAAEYFGLDVHGTLYVILEAYRRSILKSKKEIVSIVNNMIKRAFTYPQKSTRDSYLS